MKSRRWESNPPLRVTRASLRLGATSASLRKYPCQESMLDGPASQTERADHTQGCSPPQAAVTREGLEPSRRCRHRLLRPVCLPIPPPSHSSNQWTVEGIEPSLAGCKPAVFPLDDTPIVNSVTSRSRTCTASRRPLYRRVGSPMPVG